MQRVVLASAAEEDMVKILAWTHEHFGEQARLRYEALLAQSIIVIAENPERAGSMSREELPSALARTICGIVGSVRKRQLAMSLAPDTSCCFESMAKA